MTTTKKTMATCVMLLVLASGARGDEGDPLARFQEALRLEESDGDAARARDRYEALVADASLPAGLRARALVRAGVCRERLGDAAGATAAYERVLAEMSQAEEACKEAREGLERLEARTPPWRRGTVERLPGEPARVRVDVEDAEVRALLVEVAKAGGLSIVISPDVRGQCTLRLEAQEPRAALEAIASGIGQYAVLQGRSGVLRVQSSSSIQDGPSELRAYRLRPRPACAETAAARRRLRDQVHQLRAASATPGGFAILDPTRDVMLVRAVPTEWAAVELLLEGERIEEPTARAGQGPRVSLELEEASLPLAIAQLARLAEHPLLVGPDVRGSVTVHARDLPALDLLDDLVITTGGYVRVRTPAGDQVVSRSTALERLELEVWPLRASPADVWGGSWTLPSDGGVRAYVELLARCHALSVEAPGCGAALDPVAHALVVQMPRPELALLRDALASAGYVDPAPTPSKLELRAIAADTNLRTLLAELAREAGRDVIISPDVRGVVSGTIARGETLEATLLLLAQTTGDYEVVTSERGILHVRARSDVEDELATARIPLRERDGAKGSSLGTILGELARRSSARGALVLHEPEAGFLLATLPRPLLAQVQAAVAKLDRVALDRTYHALSVSSSGLHLAPAVHAIGPDAGWVQLRGLEVGRSPTGEYATHLLSAGSGTARVTWDSGNPAARFTLTISRNVGAQVGAPEQAESRVIHAWE